METLFKMLVVRLLTDEHGISEGAYSILIDVGLTLHFPDTCRQILEAIKRSESGRYYLPDGFRFPE